MPNQPREDNRAHSIRCDDTLWAAVVEAAVMQDVPVSEVVREALRRHLAHSPAEPDECP